MSNTDTLVCQLRSLGDEGFPIAWRAADALTAQAREIEALKAQLAHQAKSWGREREIDEETIEALRAVLDACRSTCTRIIEQDGGILGGVDFHALRKGIDAAMQSGKAAEPDATKCRKCNGNMRPGTYLEQTFSGAPDFPGDTHAVTVSPAGPGRLAECLKCDLCGWSVTAGKAGQG